MDMKRYEPFKDGPYAGIGYLSGVEHESRDVTRHLVAYDCGCRIHSRIRTDTEWTRGSSGLDEAMDAMLPSEPSERCARHALPVEQAVR